MPDARIGIVGVGLMGLAMAERLLEQGYAVAVHDIDEARMDLARLAGARTLASAAQVAADCELLIVAVVDGVQTGTVLFGTRGVAQSMARGGCVMLCPTIGPIDVDSAAGRLTNHGLACIDAPMSGGPLRARAGTMSLMVACPQALFEQWSGLLSVLASKVFHVGHRPGDGARTKLVNNLLAAINLAGAAEAMALAEHLGLDPGTTLDVIEQSSGQSWIGIERMRRVLCADATPSARMGLLAKDAGLAMACATGLDLALGQAAAERFARACRDGQADDEDATLWRRRGD